MMAATVRTARMGVVMMIVVCFTSCGTPQNRDRPPGQFAATNLTADEKQIFSELESAKLAIADRQRPAAERDAVAEALGRKLERWAEQVRGQDLRVENYILLSLAEFRFHRRSELGTGGVLTALDRLDACKDGRLKSFGAAIRVRALLRRGELARARSEAESLEERVPEFGAAAKRWVDFQRLVGATVPIAPGRVLTAPTAAAGSAPWQLMMFVGTFDADAQFAVARALTIVAASGGRLRLHVVAFDGSPLIMAPFQKLPHAATATLTWVGKPEDGEIWANLWRMPPEPSAVLIGPDGTIMAVDVTAPLALTLVDGQLVR